MSKDYKNFFGEGDFFYLIKRFEKMIAEGSHYFFDVDEFEDIFSHYIENREIKKALRVIKIAKKQHPGTMEFLLREAEIIAGKNPKQALTLIEKIEPLEPLNSEVQLVKASVFNRLGQHKNAIQCLKLAAKTSDEGLDYIFLTLAYEYEEIENYNKALEHLFIGLDKNPENQEIIYEIAYCYEQLGKEDECISFYQRFIDENPYSEAAWYNLGNAYCKLELFEKAIEAYDFAIAIKDDFSSAYYNKANTFSIMEKYPKAIATYHEALEIESNDPFLYFFIAECYEKMENFDQAFEFYDQSVKMDEGFAEGWLGMGVIKDYQGKTTESISFIKKALEIEKRNPGFWSIYAHLLQNTGFIEEAEEAFRKIIELDKDNIEVWLDYSSMLFENDCIDKAIGIISEGVNIHPGSAELYYRMVAYLLSLGYDNDAEDILCSALQIDFEKHNQLFDYMPHSKNHEFVLDLIESFKEQ